VAIDDLAKRSHPTMDALEVLQGTTHSQSAGAPLLATTVPSPPLEKLTHT